MFRKKKIPVGRIIPPFFVRKCRIWPFLNYLHDSNSFFWAQRIKSELFFGRTVSGMVEARTVSGIFGDPTLPRQRRLHLEAFRVPGAGAWLTANPSCVDSRVPSSLFRVALQRRLRLPLWDQDSACSMCGEVLDRWGDHVLSRCCGGDRILRHNAVRDVVCSAVAEFTSVSLELEKPGLLLPPRPPDPVGPHPPSPRPPPAAALPISGFPGASLASLRPGISRFLRYSAPLTSPRPLHLLPMSSMKWRPGSAPPRTRPHWLPSAGHLLPTGLGGLWERVVPSLPGRCGLDCIRIPYGPRPGHQLTHGHQPQDCTAHQLHPFTGKSRVQS